MTSNFLVSLSLSDGTTRMDFLCNLHENTLSETETSNSLAALNGELMEKRANAHISESRLNQVNYVVIHSAIGLSLN